MRRDGQQDRSTVKARAKLPAEKKLFEAANKSGEPKGAHLKRKEKP